MLWVPKQLVTFCINCGPLLLITTMKYLIVSPKLIEQRHTYLSWSWSINEGRTERKANITLTRGLANMGYPLHNLWQMNTKEKRAKRLAERWKQRKTFSLAFPPFGVVACLDSLGMKEKDAWVSRAYKNSSLSVQMRECPQ